MATESQKCTPEHSAENWLNKTLHTAPTGSENQGLDVVYVMPTISEGRKEVM